jgi:NADPH:quinone reductase-like Zn-dependent oxidoreductase
MKYFTIEKFGVDGLREKHKDVPRPGPRQVVVRVHANSLNYRDLRVIQGLYDPKMPLPRIPFSDGAGDVAEVGADVTRFKSGDRVAAIFMQTWISGPPQERYAASALGGALDGMLAEYVVLHEDGLVRIPDHLSYEQASTLPCAAVTAWHALIDAGQIKPGDTVLVQGTGGVSVFALQFALMAGARVIATSSSDEKLEKIRSLGAGEGINYRSTPQWARRAKQSIPTGVDHVVEVGGAGTLPQSLHATRYGGHIAVIGVLSGLSGEIPTSLILHKSIRITGIYVGSREMFEAMNRAIELHRIEPVVDQVFGVGELPAALAHMESGAHFGKIVIRHS